MNFPREHHVSRETIEVIRQQLELDISLNLIVQSNSMAPVFWAGHTITVKKLPPILKKYDIVVFWTGEVLISHYFKHQNFLIPKNGERTIVTSGLNTHEDLPLPYSKLVGIVVSHKLSFWRKLLLEIRRLTNVNLSNSVR